MGRVKRQSAFEHTQNVLNQISCWGVVSPRALLTIYTFYSIQRLSANSECPDQTARNWEFAVCICPKTRFCMAYLFYDRRSYSLTPKYGYSEFDILQSGVLLRRRKFANFYHDTKATLTWLWSSLYFSGWIFQRQYVMLQIARFIVSHSYFLHHNIALSCHDNVLILTVMSYCY